MPLPGVGDTVKQCTARAKHSGARCRNPAVVDWGSSGRVCRMHGARRSETVRRGANHPQYRHGGETLAAKAERHEMAVFFHEAERLMFALDMVAPGSTRARGRKPRSEGPVDVIEQRKCHGRAGGRLFHAGKSQDKRKD
jgi:hypothetical protein